MPPLLPRVLLVLATVLVAPATFAQAAPEGSAPAEAQPSARATGPALGSRVEPAPRRLESIDVVERLGERLPLDLEFVDERGRIMRLGDAFDGTHPVIVTLNYSDCPMLCSLQLDGFTKALAALPWTAGAEFRIVTVSLNPEEQPERALRTQGRYVAQYGRPEAAAGWNFLTGQQARVQALADAIGFKYGYNEARDEYVHPAAMVIATPDGRIARYLYGIEYLPATLRLSLSEASDGRIGSTVDRLILYCFHYDETEGRYAPVAWKIMRLGGVLAVLALGALLSTLWLAEFRRRKREVPASP